jgi:hypothetical protein
MNPHWQIRTKDGKVFPIYHASDQQRIMAKCLWVYLHPKLTGSSREVLQYIDEVERMVAA